MEQPTARLKGVGIVHLTESRPARLLSRRAGGLRREEPAGRPNRMRARRQARLRLRPAPPAAGPSLGDEPRDPRSIGGRQPRVVAHARRPTFRRLKPEFAERAPAFPPAAGCGPGSHRGGSGQRGCPPSARGHADDQAAESRPRAQGSRKARGRRGAAGLCLPQEPPARPVRHPRRPGQARAEAVRAERRRPEDAPVASARRAARRTRRTAPRHASHRACHGCLPVRRLLGARPPVPPDSARLPRARGLPRPAAWGGLDDQRG